MRTQKEQQRRGAFTLVEVLVVIGIISLLAGMLMPALSRARRSAQAALCLSNLRQLGQFYYIYANANQDRIPLGTSAIRPDQIDYYTAWNNFVWREGAPSCAAGPFILNGYIKPSMAKLFYCPLEAREPLQFENFESLFERALNGEGVSIQTSYAVRPTRNVWIADPATHTVEYPLMPKLVKLKHLALMSEYPQARPFNHGEPGTAYVNVLYADASVRQVPYKAFNYAYEQYVYRAPFPLSPGFTPPSNAMAFDEANNVADTVWQNIDRY